jgi:gamma-glutamyltranspeptidase / glutathione hydrolase
MSPKYYCRLLLPAIALISFNAVAQKSFDAFHYTPQKQVECTNGAVVSAQALASEVGNEILREGGNAVDAVIATQFALAVVYPGAGNIGGGGFAVIHLASGKNVTIDFREKASKQATRDMYLDAKGNPQPELSQNGHLSSGVPGSVAGIFLEMQYAKFPLKRLIQPAIDLAENGFTISGAEAKNLNSTESDFKKYNTVTPVFVKAGGWKSGDTLFQRDLARTLTRIRDAGQKGFYEGETARLIVEEMKRGKGIISLDDLKNYDAKEREPMVFDYKKEYTIVTMPLPSSGGVLLPLMMHMVEDYPMSTYGYGTLQSVHLMTEIERLAYADRAKFLGDKDFYNVPVEMLTSREYAKKRMQLFDPAKAGKSTDIQAGNIPVESKQTTHFESYDSQGNAVSVTTTLNNSYGSKTVVGGAGFILNDEMDDFSIKPGVPNLYGAVGGDANAIQPGKRMLSSMTPTIVLKNNKPYVIVGTPGGTTITTSVFQTIVDILEFGLSTADAVNKPKFHHQWLPDHLLMERDFSQEVREGLKQMGYKIVLTSQIGRTEVIQVYPDGKIIAVGDKRGEDSADGY